jgi:O-antigen/teichoic acid export membrane protein
LAQRSVRSSIYNVSASIIQTLVLAIRSIVLARLLSPDDFGIYTFFSSIIILTSSLPNFGMSAAYIHRAKESEGEEALRIYFTLTVLFNVLWATVLIIIAFLFVAPATRWVFITILLTQVVDNLARVGQTNLIKRVAFRRIAAVETITALSTTVIAIILANRGYQVWSLVSTDILASLVVVVGFYIYRPIWQPRFSWSSDVVRYFLNFGRRTFTVGILGQILDRVDDLWTGFFLGENALGFYSRAYTFATYPRKILGNPLTVVAGGTYAELKDKPKALSQAFFRVNALLIRAGFFLSGLFSLIAPEFIILIIGPKWLPMLTAFRLMLVYTLLDPIKGTIGNLFVSIGYPEKVVRIRIIQVVILLVLLFALGPIGIVGVALAVDIMVFVGIVFLLGMARQYVRFSLKKLLFPPVTALTVSILLSYFVMQYAGIQPNSWLSATVKTCVFATSFGLVLSILEFPFLLEGIQALKKILTRQEHAA